MKPQLVTSENTEGSTDKPAPETRREQIKARWFRLDRIFTTLGEELCGILIIFLALAILCAPVGLGLAITYYLASWAVRATGSAFNGWVVAIAVFSFLCRYVWGIRLQRAARRAAEALIAGSN